MKKIFKFLLKLVIVLVILAVIAAALIFVFVGKDNVKAALKGLTTSTEDLEKNIQQSEKLERDLLKEHGFEISEEDMQSISSGELSDESAIIDKLLGREEKDGEVTEDESSDSQEQPQDEPQNKDENKPVTGSEEQKPETDTKPKEEKPSGKTESKPSSSANTSDTPKKDDSTSQNKPTSADSTVATDNKQKEVDEQVAALVAKMYVYKSQYSGSISSLVSSMSSEYYALPAEQRNYSSKVSIYNKYASQISTMEAQCDAQVNALVSELKALLTKNGRDTSLADSLLSAYAAEKENTKAYYVSRYAD